MPRKGPLAALGLAACGPAKTDGEVAPPPVVDGERAAPDPERADERADMVRVQLAGRDIDDARVLAAMGAVPRHRFVPEELASRAYDDRALPIGHDVTISQPYIVALMTQLAEVGPGQRVLDVGTGSGYQAAVLAELGAEVYGIEIIEPLAEQARRRLAALGYDRVTVRTGDGYRGWPEHAPFAAIIVAAAPTEVPEPLLEQLQVGGKLVLPVGARWDQTLMVYTRTRNGYDRRQVTAVAFVPMTGEALK